jgi:hypothetical protein
MGNPTYQVHDLIIKLVCTLPKPSGDSLSSFLSPFSALPIILRVPMISISQTFHLVYENRFPTEETETHTCLDHLDVDPHAIDCGKTPFCYIVQLLLLIWISRPLATWELFLGLYKSTRRTEDQYVAE